MLEKSLIRDNFDRLREIAGILSKYELDEISERLNLPKFGIGKRKVRHLTTGQKIKNIFQELGPTFIKFGQTLSCHPDILPQDIIRELEKLQDNVPPFDTRDAERIIRDSLKKPVTEIFSEFDPTPIASASIAQVHTAKLPNGEKVAVKIQRPNIENAIRKDLELLHVLAILAEKNIHELKRYELNRMVSEFERSIEKEIDFRLEADNLDRFRKNFAGIAEIHFPEVHHEFSNRYVLTLEYIHGAKINSIARADSVHDRRLVAQRGVSAIYKQIFEDGFFHADPHNGNIIVMKDDVVCFVDAGMVGVLNEEAQNLLMNLLIAVSDKNTGALISLFVSEGMLPASCDIERLKEDVDDLFNGFYGADLQRIDIAEILNRFIRLVYAYRITLPPSFLTLIRCLIILEGVGRQIDPEFNPTESMIPYAQKLLKKQFQPARIIGDFQQFFRENIWLMKSFPNDFLLFMQKIMKGKFEIKLDHEGFDDLNRTLNRASSRLTSGIVIAGMIVASAFIIRSNLPPLIDGYSVIGVAGYILSGCAAVMILVRVLRDIS